MSDTTTLKLPPRLKTRIAKLARETGRAPHAVMVEALEREISPPQSPKPSRFFPDIR